MKKRYYQKARKSGKVRDWNKFKKISGGWLATVL
jgi:hypothetical protein